MRTAWSLSATRWTLVFGYGVGLDLTRRDLQAVAKDKGLPWDTAKGFDALRAAAAPWCRPHRPATRRRGACGWKSTASCASRRPLTDMVFGVAEILHELSKLFALKAGDLVFMGTPAGVAALQRGDRFRAGVDGIAEFSGRIA